MSFVAALQALTATGAFAARAFLPLFVLGIIARFPGVITWIPFCPDPPLMLPPALAWMASTWCLMLLGALALVEIRAEKDQDIRDLLAEIEAPLKGVAAILGALMIADGDTRALLAHVAGAAPVLPGAPDGAAASLSLGAVAVAGLAGGASFMLARWRRAGLRDLHDAGDDVGLARPLSWLEDAWVLAGLILLLVAPLLAAVGALVLLALIALGRRALEARAEARRRPCPGCRRPARPEAQACAGCTLALEPTAEPSSRAWPDRWADVGGPGSASLRGRELLARGRCPACAERRPVAELLSHLPCSCGWPEHHPGITSVDWRRDLLLHVERRARRLMLVTALLGVVPVAGAASALVLARVRIATPLRRWLPVSKRLLARWTTRLLIALLVLLSGVPLVSVLIGPLIVAITWRTWSRAFADA